MKFKSLKLGKNKNDEIEETIVEQPDAPVAPGYELPPEPVYPEPAPEPIVPGLTADITPPAPHGPMAELTLDDIPPIDTGDRLVDFGGIEPPVTPDDDTEEINVVEVNAGEVAAVKGENGVPAEETAEEEAKDSSLDDALSSLFSDDEEEENPLASLIASLPDVTVQELMDDIQEIKEIMQEWRHH